MKILYMHTKNLRIEAGINGRSPGEQRKNERKLRGKFHNLLPILDDANRITESKDALLAFICVEKGDERVHLDAVKTDVLKAKALLGVSEIIISAFAHLSGDVASAQLAKGIVESIACLVQAEYPVKVIPFGWDKSLNIHIPLHHYNVAFRSFGPQRNGES